MHTRPIAGSTLLALAALAHAGETVIAESTFESGDEGWIYPVSAVWNASGGHPGGALFGAVPEPNNITPTAEAPPDFLGDWSALDQGAGELRFDFTLIDLGQGGVMSISPITATIIGPGGAARWFGPTPSGPLPWTTYVAPIDNAHWTLLSGDWNALLADVQTLRFPLELVSNGGPAEDWQALDNVRLVLLTPDCPPDFNNDGLLDFFDVQLFLQAFSSHDAAADLNDDTLFDFFDVQLFLQAFSAGCA